MMMSDSPKHTVLESLNRSLLHAMQSDERVYLLGEDITDPYGGSFKVTKGLSTAFPGRVLSTPISEAGFTGIAAGMAMRGLLPVVEIMFGDFVTLIADQVINHISKFSWMYGEDVHVPLVIRTPMGGRRGYGPTHSQTLEKLFFGVPGLVVLAPTALGDAGRLLESAIFEEEMPVIFIENKLLYTSRLFNPNENPDFVLQEIQPRGESSAALKRYPVYELTIAGAPEHDLTLVTYGYMAEIAREAMLRLAYDDEIFIDLIVMTAITQPYERSTQHSLAKTGRLLILEEGTAAFGWGTEIVASVVENAEFQLQRVKRLAGMNSPIPASGYLEKQILPGVEDVIKTVRQMVRGTQVV